MLSASTCQPSAMVILVVNNHSCNNCLLLTGSMDIQRVTCAWIFCFFFIQTDICTAWRCSHGTHVILILHTKLRGLRGELEKNQKPFILCCQTTRKFENTRELTWAAGECFLSFWNKLLYNLQTEEMNFKNEQQIFFCFIQWRSLACYQIIVNCITKDILYLSFCF